MIYGLKQLLDPLGNEVLVVLVPVPYLPVTIVHYVYNESKVMVSQCPVFSMRISRGARNLRRIARINLNVSLHVEQDVDDFLFAFVTIPGSYLLRVSGLRMKK